MTGESTVKLEDILRPFCSQKKKWDSGEEIMHGCLQRISNSGSRFWKPFLEAVSVDRDFLRSGTAAPLIWDDVKTMRLLERADRNELSLNRQSTSRQRSPATLSYYKKTWGADSGEVTY